MPSPKIEFWLGRAGSGKTQACVEAIAGELRRAPRGTPLILLVPEQASAQMEYALATPPGVAGFTRARVMSFRLLQAEVFRRVGGRPARCLDERGRVMLLRQAIARCRSRLWLLGGRSAGPGLAEAVSRTLRELQESGWGLREFRARLEAQAGGDDPGGGGFAKLSDLLTIWAAYDDLLGEKGLAEAIELPSVAAERLAEWGGVADAQVWVDGFASFTAAEFKLLMALLGGARSAALTLCLDPEDQTFRRRQSGAATPAEGLVRVGPERVFEEIENHYFHLKARIQQAGWPTVDISFPRRSHPTRAAHVTPLSFLEAEVLTRLNPSRFPDADRPEGAAPVWPVGPIELVEAADRRAEVEAIARRIAALVAASAEPGSRPLRWSDMAVVARDLTEYGPLVREVFPRFGIPFFLDQGRSLASHPITRLLTAALALVEGPTRTETVSRYLKSGLVPLADPEDAARLERLARRRRLTGSDWGNLRRWVGPRHGQPGPSTKEEVEAEWLFQVWAEAWAPVEALGAALAALEAGDGPTQADGAPGGAAEAGSSPARALWAFLERLGARQKLEQWVDEALQAGEPEAALLHQEAWAELVAFLERLEELGLPGPVPAAGAGSDSTGAVPSAEGLVATLTEALAGALSAARARLIPPAVEQVIVASVERSRLPNVRVAFVLGLAEGEFPRTQEEDPLLSDTEREALGTAQQTLGRHRTARLNHERYLAYIALTRPSERLVLTRPMADSGGRLNPPSPVFRAVAEAFPMAPRGTPLPSAANLAPVLPEEWGRMVVEASHRARAGMSPAVIGQALAGPHPLCAALEGPAADAARRRIERTIAALDWPPRGNLERELARAFWSERPRLAVTALETHAACPFKFFASNMLRLEEPAEPLPGPLEMGQVRHRLLAALFAKLKGAEGLDWGGVDLAEADKAIDEAAAEIRADLLGGSLGADALTQKLVEFVIAEMRVLLPALKEVGRRSRLRQVEAEGPLAGSLVLDAGEGLAFTVTGKIDRKDAMAEAGAAPGALVLYDYKSGGRDLSATDLYYGIDLQLAAYALAETRRVSRPVLGVFYWPVGVRLIRADGSSWPEPGTRPWFDNYKLKGLFDVTIARDLDTEILPNGENALAFSFRLKKDGGVDFRSFGPLPEGSFGRYLSHVEQLMRERARRIADGEINLHPWRRGGGTACDQCAYEALCRKSTFEGDVFHTEAGLDRSEFRRRFAAGGGSDDQ